MYIPTKVPMYINSMCVGVSVNILTPFIFLLQVLQTELSVLKHNQPRIHELSTYLMLSDVDEIARVTKSHLGSKATDDQAREDLMHRLQVRQFIINNFFFGRAGRIQIFYSHLTNFFETSSSQLK